MQRNTADQLETSTEAKSTSQKDINDAVNLLNVRKTQLQNAQTFEQHKNTLKATVIEQYENVINDFNILKGLICAQGSKNSYEDLERRLYLITHDIIVNKKLYTKNEIEKYLVDSIKFTWGQTFKNIVLSCINGLCALMKVIGCSVMGGVIGGLVGGPAGAAVATGKVAGGGLMAMYSFFNRDPIDLQLKKTITSLSTLRGDSAELSQPSLLTDVNSGRSGVTLTSSGIYGSC